MRRLAALAIAASATGIGAAEDARKEGPMSKRATGTFQVKVTPIADGRKDAVESGRLTLDKTFQGELEGSSHGEMWTAEGGVAGSAGYVAIEKVSGSLRGRRGSFKLLHQGTMRRGGEFALSVAVVPESGTDELEGLSGRMTIVVADGRHSYELEYRLPDTARSADGLPIRFEAAGAGEPALLFVHGWALDRRIWDSEVKRLAPRHRVVVLDLAGHGDSGRERARWTVAGFAQDVIAVASGMDAKTIVLVGHSMGGPIVIEAARALAGRVLGVVLVDTVQDAAARIPAQEAAAFAKQIEGDYKPTITKFVTDDLLVPRTPAAVRERVLQHVLALAPRDSAGMLLEAWTHDPLPSLAAIKAPVRAVNADKYPTNLEANRRYMPGYEATIVPGTGHYPMLEDPAAYEAAFDRALAQIVSRRPEL